MMGIFQIFRSRRRLHPHSRASKPLDIGLEAQSREAVDSPRPSLPMPRETTRSPLESQHTVQTGQLQKKSLNGKKATMHSTSKTNIESRSCTIIENLPDHRPAGIVAKLMGLVDMPGSKSLPNSPSPQFTSRKAISKTLSRKGTPILRDLGNPVDVPKKIQAESKRQPNLKVQNLEGVSETRRLEMICTKNNQSSEMIHTKNVPRQVRTNTENKPRPNTRDCSRSPIMIMKPLRSIPMRSSSPTTCPVYGLPSIQRIHTTRRKGDLVSHNSARSPRLTKEVTVSPRQQLGNSEAAKARKQQSTVKRVSIVDDLSPSPSKNTASQQIEYWGRKSRHEVKDKRLSNISANKTGAEVNARLASNPKRNQTTLAPVSIHRHKDSHNYIELEQPSPVYVLDASIMGDSSRTLAKGHRLILKEEGSQSSVKESCTVKKKKPIVKNGDNVLRKIWPLAVLNGEDDDDGGVDVYHVRGEKSKQEMIMAKVTNPDDRYIYKILQASKILETGFDDRSMTKQLHKSGLVIAPGLFFLVEKSNMSKSKEEKLHRRLLFDAVNEVLTKKIKLNGSVRHERETLFEEICQQINRLKSNSVRTKADSTLSSMVSTRLEEQSEEWVELDKGTSIVVLDIERTLFRDLVNDLINVELTTALSLSAKSSWQSRRLRISKSVYG